MLYATVKVLLTSVLVVAVSETAKRSALFGAVIASNPLTSVLAMIWLYGLRLAGSRSEAKPHAFFCQRPSASCCQ